MSKSRPKVPFVKKTVRKDIQKDPSFSRPNTSTKIYLVGPGESGKSAIFKQVLFANGMDFEKKDRKLLRYHLIKTLVMGSCAMIKFCKEINSTMLEEYPNEVRLVDNYRRKNMPPDQDQKKMMKLVMPDAVKTAVVTLWNHEDFQTAFRACMQSGNHHVVESYRLIVEKLAKDPSFYSKFASKDYLPENEMTLLSNGHKYHLEQKLFYQVEPNQYLKRDMMRSGNVNFNQKPELRKEILQNPLRTAKFGIGSSTPFWKFTLIEWKPQDGKPAPSCPSKKPIVPPEHSLVFTADLSSYDTVMGPAQNYREDAVGFKTGSLLARAKYEFKEEFKRGNIIALVFTNVDIFRRKYLEENLPINKLGDFPTAPIREDEEPNSIRQALAYFKSYFRAAVREIFEESATTTETRQLEKKNNLLKILCINGLDLENVQATLTSILESYYGLNIPIKNRGELFE